MDKLTFSFIIPVYNRPEELQELLESFLNLSGKHDFEIVIVEDGSDEKCETVVENFKGQLNICYYYKLNSGPGDSRNYGMKKAEGNYFIILDSDCLLPPKYLDEVKHYLSIDYVDCFGGPDASDDSFSDIQKAIDFSMTSIISTGGIRGGRKSQKDFQPRSFNMGISKKAFVASDGFVDIHPGEDPDLSIRLKKLGFKIALFPKAFVFHKRRISWAKFYKQVKNFGLVRPILNSWHPETDKLVFWFPSIFILGFFVAIILLWLNMPWLIVLYGIYFLIAFMMSLAKHGKIKIAFLSIIAIFIQFFGYGTAYLKAFFYVRLLRKNPRECFPILFFDQNLND